MTARYPAKIARFANHQTRFAVALLIALFMLAQCANRKPEAVNSPAVQEIKVSVKGEYSPDRIVVKKNSPVRLLFYRDDDSECTAEVVVPDLKLKQRLAVKQETALEFVPDKEGEFTFACGMDMMKGKIVVQK